MAKASTLNFDVSSFFDNAVSQFRGLNPNEPGQWPWLPRVAAWRSASWRWWWCGAGSACCPPPATTCRRERDREPVAEGRLPQQAGAGRQPGRTAQAEACQVQEYVTQLEKQLPGKAEMDALLSDINQAGLGRGPAVRAVPPRHRRGQGLLRRTADRHPRDRPVPRHRRLRRRRGQPVAHRHAAEPGHLARRLAGSRRAGHGSHRAHLPLPGRQRRWPIARRRKAAKVGGKK